MAVLKFAGVSIAGKGVALSLNEGENDGFYSMNVGQNWSYQQYGGGDNDCALADPLRPQAIMVLTPGWDTGGNLARHTVDGQTAYVFQTQPGNRPDASASGHDRKAVTGPPTVPNTWNGSSFYGARDFRPVVLGGLGEDAPDQGDYGFVVNPVSSQPVVVRMQNIFDIKHRFEWVTSATGPGQGANVYLQGPPLPEAHLGNPPDRGLSREYGLLCRRRQYQDRRPQLRSQHQPLDMDGGGVGLDQDRACGAHRRQFGRREGRHPVLRQSI